MSEEWKNDYKTIAPATGYINLPNGHTLFWKNTEFGREYFSDEVGGGVFVWHAGILDENTLLRAITLENEFQTLERNLDKKMPVVEDEKVKHKTGFQQYVDEIMASDIFEEEL